MMKKEDVLKQYTTPIAAPAFVQGPHRFRRREYLNITYRTDREALEKLVPEPLEIDQPLVRFEVMKMPDTTGYGAYVECGQAAVVRLGKEQGEFLLAMYLDNLPAIAAGRELSAFPKKLGAAKLFVDSDTLVGMGTVDDIGQTAAFLASPLATYISGCVVVCDGGSNLVGSGRFNANAEQILQAQAKS